MSMSEWKTWNRQYGKPDLAEGRIDVQYADGKEFHNRRAADCYWGKDSLIKAWRKHRNLTEMQP